MNFKENGRKKSFSYKTKASNHLSQWKEHIYNVLTQKEYRLSWESKFVPIGGQTLILRKVVEEKSFLVKPKTQYHVSQL